MTIAAVHWKNGLWVSDGGFEFPLVLAAVAFAVTAIGAGRYSLDNLFGIDWASRTWAIGATIVDMPGGLVAVALVRITHRTHRHPAAHGLDLTRTPASTRTNPPAGTAGVFYRDLQETEVWTCRLARVTLEPPPARPTDVVRESIAWRCGSESDRRTSENNALSREDILGTLAARE